jgi:hypothetical protein
LKNSEQSKQSNLNILLLDINDVIFSDDFKNISLKDPSHLKKYGKDLDLARTVIVLNKIDTKSLQIIDREIKNVSIEFEFGTIPVIAAVSIKNDDGVNLFIETITDKV